MMSGRVPFLIASILLMATVSGVVAGALPPGGLLNPAFGHPFGKVTLLIALAWLAGGMLILVIPWTLLLRRRMIARLRPIRWSYVPGGLAVLAWIALMFGALIYGAPTTGSGSLEQTAWTNHDFHMIDGIVSAAVAVAALALVLTLALIFEALRADRQGIDQVFS